jgi:hypothetical protein
VNHAYAGSSGARRSYNWTVTVAISPPQPTVTSISPTSGWAHGGDTVVLGGTNFEDGDIVRFGDDEADVTSLTPTTITVTTPSHRAGNVAVTVEHRSCPPVAAPASFTYALGAVSGFNVYSLTTGSSAVLAVTWNAYGPAQGYEIWRATTPANWTLLVVVPPSWDQLWLEDHSAAMNRAYLYKVRPVDGAHKGVFTAIQYETSRGFASDRLDRSRPRR